MDTFPQRDLSRAVRRGSVGRCPNCGDGLLFQGFLVLNDMCAKCGTTLRSYHPKAGPAFLTIAFASLLLVPILGLAAVLFGPDPAVLIAVGLLSLPFLAVLLLRVIKGAMVGYLWAQDIHGRPAGPPD